MTTCSSRNAGRFRAGPLWVKSARLDDYELDWKRKVVGNIIFDWFMDCNVGFFTGSLAPEAYETGADLPEQPQGF